MVEHLSIDGGSLDTFTLHPPELTPAEAERGKTFLASLPKWTTEVTIGGPRRRIKRKLRRS